MTRKTLLVLAASRYQLPIIITARQIGYRVLTLDNVPGNPGHALADAAFDVDTTDIEGVLAVARRERVDGIIAACTDVAVPTAAAVAEMLKLPGTPSETAGILCDKNRFRAFLQQQDWPCPEALPVTRDTVLPEDLFDHAWILKPDFSSGSKGIRIIHSHADYHRQLETTLAFSRYRQGILETFIDGWQITCEGLLVGGRIAFAAITDRCTVALPHVATRGHCLPSRLPEAMQTRVLEMLDRLWSTLGVTDGPFDSDLVIHEDTVYLLEASPRIGGNSLIRLLRSACDIDLVEYALRQAMGEPVEPPASVPCRPTGLLLLGVEQAGRLHYDPYRRATLAALPWVDSLTLDHPPGTPVQAFTDGRHRVGEALVRGNSRNQVDQRLHALRTELDLKVQP